MIGTCRLNNKNMRGIRRSEAYQCIAIDLAMLGVISREECEMLIGGGIPKNLQLPNGSSGNILSENNIPVQPVVAESELGSNTIIGDEQIGNRVLDTSNEPIDLMQQMRNAEDVPAGPPEPSDVYAADDNVE
ncbi:hypothetical protein HDR60_03030 [bacterium]|nr:hypothetical protein [bacterium]